MSVFLRCVRLFVSIYFPISRPIFQLIAAIIVAMTITVTVAITISATATITMTVTVAITVTITVTATAKVTVIVTVTMTHNNNSNTQLPRSLRSNFFKKPDFANPKRYLHYTTIFAAEPQVEFS